MWRIPCRSASGMCQSGQCIPAADLQGLSLIPLDRIPLVLAAGTVDGFSGGMTGAYERVKFLDVTVPYLSKRLELEG